MKRFAAAIATLALAGPPAARAELTATTLVEGLKTPTRIVMTPAGNLLVAESGDRPPAFVANHGRISLVDRAGTRRTLLGGLPSGLDLENNNPLGPTAISLSDRFTLYVAFGVGDVTKRNASGAEAANPAGPSSALFSSLWRVRFSRPVDDVSGFAVDPAAHYSVLADGDELQLQNDAGERARILVLADLRDLYPGAPTPNPISASNPFGLLKLEDAFYLADGGQNSVVRVDRETGRIRTITHFPNLPNTRVPPIVGPFVQPVPNGIRRLSEDEALVTLFSGFPFGVGAGRIDRVHVRSGASSAFISGLTMPIDVLPLGHSAGPFLVLEYASSFSLPGPGTPPQFVPPGRVLLFGGNAAPALLTSDLVSPASMALDFRTGELFVAELVTGKIVRFELW